MKTLKAKNKNTQGFAMLFTVLVVSLILSISLGISDLTFKQTILSNLAKDSQISFYEADTSAECALYHDITGNAFPSPTDPNTLGTLSCGDKQFSVDLLESYTDYIVFKQNMGGATNLPCSQFSVNKSSTPGTTIIQAKGYNICGTSPRKVERAVEVRY